MNDGKLFSQGYIKEDSDEVSTTWIRSERTNYLLFTCIYVCVCVWI